MISLGRIGIDYRDKALKKKEIPKIVHYCWFGGNPLGDKEKKCIESWKKYLPQYEIRRWDENNYDVYMCKYTKEAYQAKKWAFVSDYARFKVLYDYGGIYLDTDVELLQPIDDLIIKGSIMACEEDGAKDGSMGDGNILVNPGLILAAYRHHPFYKQILEEYSRRSFIRENGSYDFTTVVTITTSLLKRQGLENIQGIQYVSDIYIYPKEYFNPKDFRTEELFVTENTRAIHHFSMSWLSQSHKVQKSIYKHLIAHRVPTKTAWRIAIILSIIGTLDIERLLNAVKSKFE